MKSKMSTSQDPTTILCLYYLLSEQEVICEHGRGGGAEFFHLLHEKQVQVGEKTSK